MKKGLLALMVVAMVAMAVPAGALAPTIDPLPAVIIGSAGDTFDDGGTTMHLFRYNNILDISTSSKIEWNNADLGFGTDQMHAYYIMETGASSPIMASTSQRFVDQITAADLAAIEASGTRPAAGAEITDDAGDGGSSDFFFLSLVNNPSAASDSYTATAQANGRPAADYDMNPEVLTLALVDGDFPTTAASTAEMTVWTVADAEDSFSPAAETIVDIAFANNQNNWVFTYSAAEGFSTPGNSVGELGLTVQASGQAAQTNIYYGSWRSGDGTSEVPLVEVDEATNTGSAWRATYTLASSGATAAAVPGYRLMYMAQGLTHQGGIAVFPGEGFSAPTQSAMLDVPIYWEAPFALTAYGDDEALATIQSGDGIDFRDYIMYFEMIDFDPTDTAAIGLNNLVIDVISQPEVSANVIDWGQGGTAFNSELGTTGWAALTSYPADVLPGGFGSSTVSAGSCAISGSATALSYGSVGPYSNASGLPDWTSDQLIRLQTELSTSATNQTPTWRLLLLTVDNSGLSAAVTFFDAYDGSGAKAVYDSTEGAAPAAPASGGSILNHYYYTMTAGANCALLPFVDCYNVGPITTSRTGNVWPTASATLTLSGYTIDEVTD